MQKGRLIVWRQGFSVWRNFLTVVRNAGLASMQTVVTGSIIFKKYRICKGG